MSYINITSCASESSFNINKVLQRTLSKENKKEKGIPLNYKHLQHIIREHAQKLQYSVPDRDIPALLLA